MTSLLLSFLDGSSSFLLIQRTTIQALMSLIFFKIPSSIIELAALDNLKN